VEKVALASPAGASGLKNLDYLIKVNGTEVFEMKHSDVVQIIKNSPNDQLDLEVERGDGNDVVPNFDWILAKEKGPQTPSEDYYAVAMKQGLGPDSEIPCMFTACGPPRLKTGKYNVPTGLYSEDTIMELGSGGNFGFVEPEKLAPDACPRAKNRKRFDPTKSSALSVLLDQEQGNFYPPTPQGPSA